ncbi:MAG: DUF429 domain-containing protein [Candidatus Dormibacteria bacterium]
MPAPPLLIGADGCRGGWLVALQSRDGTTVSERWRTAQLAAAILAPGTRVVIDIPIGLAADQPRRCDGAARRQLGWPRSSTVFSAPVRSALATDSYSEAQARQRSRLRRGLSRQTYGILDKVRQVDALAGGPGGARIAEGHPELSFQAMAGSPRGLTSKHSAAGRRERLDLLRASFPQLRLDLRPRSVEDVLDAYACLWSARRWAQGRARWLPAHEDQLDLALGRPMRIWY